MGARAATNTPAPPELTTALKPTLPLANASPSSLATPSSARPLNETTLTRAAQPSTMSQPYGEVMVEIKRLAREPLASSIPFKFPRARRITALAYDNPTHSDAPQLSFEKLYNYAVQEFKMDEDTEYLLGVGQSSFNQPYCVDDDESAQAVARQQYGARHGDIVAIKFYIARMDATEAGKFLGFP